MNYIREFFLPTERNGAVPLGLSPRAFAGYLIIATLLVVAPQYALWSQLATLAKPTLYSAGDVLALVNEARQTAGEPTLMENPKLTIAAQAKVEDMFAKQYFAHISPDGQKPWSFFATAGYRYLAAGENLAVDFLTARAAENAFMASPTHRANILNPSYTEIGVGIGQGEYRGRPSIMIAQYFGRPADGLSGNAKTVSKTTAKRPVSGKSPMPMETTGTLSIAPVPPTVLGMSDPVEVPALFGGVSVTDWSRLALLLLIALNVLPFLLAFVRQGWLPYSVVFRTGALLAACAIALAIGLPVVPGPHVATPAAFSDISWLGL